MSRASLAVAALVCMCAVGVAGAAVGDWTQLGNIPNTAGLTTDGTTLWDVNYSQINQYNPLTDSWTPVATAPYTEPLYVTWSPGEGDTVKYVDGNIITRRPGDQFLTLYDVAGKSFSQTTIPVVTAGDTYYGQLGTVTLPGNKLACMYYEAGTTNGYYIAVYDVANKSWGTPYAMTTDPTYLGRMQGQTVGNYVIQQVDVWHPAGNTVQAFVQNMTGQTGTQVLNGTWNTVTTTTTGQWLWGGDNGMFGTEPISVDPKTGMAYIMSVNPGYNQTTISTLGAALDGWGPAPTAPTGEVAVNQWIYDLNSPLLGKQPNYGQNLGAGQVFVWTLVTRTYNPLELVSYDPASGQFVQLPNGPIAPGTYRDFDLSNVCNGYIYLQVDGNFYAVQVTPEPATMVLLAVGGIGMLLRRRRMA